MEFLIKARKIKNISQYDIAKKLGITRGAYSHYEGGRALPTADTLIKLAEILDVSVDYLLTGKEYSNNTNFTTEQMEVAKLLKLMNQKQLNRVHGYVLGLLEQNADYKAN